MLKTAKSAQVSRRPIQLLKDGDVWVANMWVLCHNILSLYAFTISLAPNKKTLYKLVPEQSSDLFFI